MTTLIYLIGKAGTGKYTIAKELGKFGYCIADNQLVNNPIFALLNYDGYSKIPQFAWDTIKQIRDIILDFIANERSNNYVLTNCLFEEEGDRKLYHQIKETAAKRGSLFIPVKLNISVEENARRINNPERALRYKSLALDEDHEKPLLTIEHSNLLELDVTNISAANAAKEILKFTKQRNR